jgi:Uncharacterized conserved protein (DUF2358)
MMFLHPRPLIRCCVLAAVAVHVQGLAFDPTLHRRQVTSRPSLAATSSKCPFAAFAKMAGLKKHDSMTEANQSPPPVQYNDTNQSRAASIAMVAMAATLPNDVLSPFESWCVMNVERWYDGAIALKCPFFRRRASDLLDATDLLMRLFIVRNKSLLGPPPSLRGIKNSSEKSVGLAKEELIEVIRKDWREDTNKGYYVTGRLSSNIYRDDCLFDGPDPDMPVKGLRKYLNAAAQLFDQRTSRSELLSLKIEGDVIVATWRFSATMHLPWKPKLPEVTGSTIYHMDASGLIYQHVETWDISAFQAFFRTFFPKLSERIWPANKRGRVIV